MDAKKIRNELRDAIYACLAEYVPHWVSMEATAEISYQAATIIMGMIKVLGMQVSGQALTVANSRYEFDLEYRMDEEV